MNKKRFIKKKQIPPHVNLDHPIKKTIQIYQIIGNVNFTLKIDYYFFKFKLETNKCEKVK